MAAMRHLHLTCCIVALAQICAILLAVQQANGETLSDLLNRSGHSYTPPPDRSLSVDDYIQRGVPAYDRIWSGTDMAKAASVLASVAQKEPGQLPRYQSHRSGILFARITADENLGLYRNRSLPVGQRITEALAYLESHNAIGKLYLKSYNQNATGDSELVEVYASLLRMWLTLMPLLDEFIATLDKSDPSYSVRMGGLNKVRTGLATSVSAVVETLTERQSYRTSELKRLASNMTQTLPKLLPYVPDGTRTETMVRLRSLGSDPKMHDLNPELAELIYTVEQTAPATKQK
jgi:hypothetical protein